MANQNPSLKGVVEVDRLVELPANTRMFKVNIQRISEFAARTLGLSEADAFDYTKEQFEKIAQAAADLKAGDSLVVDSEMLIPASELQ